MTMGTFTCIDQTTLWEADGTDLLKASNAFQVVLCTSAEALTASSLTNGLYSDLAHEVANGNGYTTGGVVLTGVTLTRSGGTTSLAWTGPSPLWTASGSGIPAWRWIVLYVNATLNGHVKPVVGFALGDSTPADVPLTPSGSTIAVNGTAINITHSP